MAAALATLVLRNAYDVDTWLKGIWLTAGGMVQENNININILCDTHLELPL